MYRDILPSEIKFDKTLLYQYFLDKEHPLASKGVYRVYYHRHVASIKLGRWLSPDEVVHHTDGNRANNSESNLEVLSSKEHSELHKKQEGYVPVELVCPVCNNTFIVSDKRVNLRVTCSVDCATKLQTHWKVSKEELETLIWNMSYVDISKKYNISDVGAKKRAKALGCKLPPPYFFNKNPSFRQEQRRLNNIPDLPTQQSSKLLA